MNFSIGESTGTIFVSKKGIPEKDLPTTFPFTTKTELEAISKAVKKTKKILGYEQPQDSKNTEYYPWDKSSFLPTSKAKQNKEDTRLYSALKYIIQDNLSIPCNLTSEPTDEYSIDYQSRLTVAQMIASEFKKLTGKDIEELSE